MTRALVAMTCVMTAVIAITLWLHTIVTPADVMIRYAQDAVEYARKHHRVELDYSEESIEQLESLLAEMRRQTLSEEQRTLYSKMWAGYFGEVIRRQHGGVWQQQTAGEYVLAVKGAVVCPQKLVGGDGLGSYYDDLLREWSR